MPKRRSMLIGMGALAMGSGAAFSSATFQNSLSANGDFRVVVDDELLVEPGEAFRDGDGDGDGSGGFAPWAGENWASSDSLFGGGDPLSDVEKAASMNDATNDQLEIQVATGLNEGSGKENEFTNFLQVGNNGNTHREVAIGFEGESGFGSDVSINNAASEITPDDVRDIYEFEVNGNKVSENSYEEVPHHISLEPGQTKQIKLVVDTTGYRNDIVELAGGTDPFNSDGESATVDLVDEVRFGTQNDDGQTDA